MSSFLTLSGISAATPDGRPLFHDLTLSLGAERVGLVGRNGSGKSTLLGIAAGDAEPLSGTVHRTGTAGRLLQRWRGEDTIAEALGVADPLAILDRIEAGDGTDADLDDADWTLPAAIESGLVRVGLAALDLHRRMESLSGGEQTRIGLARLVLERPDLLLLDEPTNNLDSIGREAIEQLIESWRGGVLVASHDRALLEHMDRIVELNPTGVRIVGGCWSAFAAAREAQRALAETERERSQAALRSTLDAAQASREAKQRRDSRGRAFAARGSEPRILLGAQAERAQNSGGQARRLADRQVEEATRTLELARARVEILTPLTIEVPATGLPPHTEVLALEEVEAEVGDRQFGPWTFALHGRERVVITGPNGAGKSTLLRLAMGELVPSKGTVRRASQRVAMLDQHLRLLDPQDTILGNLRRLHPLLDEEAAHAACARFAFRSRDTQRIVGTLSGGERLRAALATVLSAPQSPWLLILDEPTNHMDIESIEVLEAALQAFDGALLVVSHDARFLEAVGAMRTLTIGDDRVAGTR
jgi:ATPase subunit of ABC transporter with duplicated ATPase domains